MADALAMPMSSQAAAAMKPPAAPACREASDSTQGSTEWLDESVDPGEAMPACDEGEWEADLAPGPAPARVSQGAASVGTSMCQLCKASFFGLDYHQPYYGLTGVTRQHCQNCWRSVCAECSSNTWPLRVSNLQERVCDKCFEELRATGVTPEESRRQMEKMRAVQAQRERREQEES